MEELLKKLLDANILSEETKSELEVAIKAQLEEAVQVAREAAEMDMRAELKEAWVAERDALIEAVDSKISSSLVDEIAELKEDIERFRDLEVEYNQKLIEARAAMKNELKKDLSALIEKLDTFLEMRLKEEIEELKEDISVVKQNDFGRRIYETFADEYIRNYADEKGTGATLKETEKRLEETSEALEESERRVAALERKIKMESVLSPLSGKHREIMEAILKNVKTENLDEGYKTFIGRVVREADEQNSEKEEKVLAENTIARKEVKGVVKTGDNVDLLESEQKTAKQILGVESLRKLAGI